MTSLKSIFLGTMSCLSSLACAQTISAELNRANIAYIGIDNPITIMAEGFFCRNLWITAHGAIEITGSGCNRVVKCKSLGEGIIKVHKIENGDTIFIGKKIIRVKPFPDQEPVLGNINRGTMGDGEIKAQQGVRVPILGFDIEASCQVQTYTLSLMRSGELIASSQNKGGIFEEATKLVLQQVKSGDQVLIDEIMVRYPGELAAREGKDIKITIK